MKSRFKSILSAVCITAVLLSGCSPAEGGRKAVSVEGSTSMEKVMGYLSEAYMEENPDVRITYNPTGSGAGIQAVSDGRCDIALSSRELSDEEEAELNVTAVAVDGIAIIVNPSNPVRNINMERLAALYRGEITTWSELGGNDNPVVLIGREAASGTRDGFESITGTEDVCKYTQELTSAGDVVQTVASNPNAVGYASLESLSDKVNVLNVNGVAPTEDSIRDGTYKISRRFLFVTPKDRTLGDEAQAFCEFTKSGAAAELIKKAGAVPAEE